MSIRLNALFLSSSLALSLLITTPAMADEWNKRSEFEFSAPVEIPGHVLTAGKYVFQLLNSPSDRNIVQVFSKDADGNESLIATIDAIPDYRNETPDKTLINLEERHAGSPEAIQSWFYPGDNTGWEFVYPKGQSLQEASNTTPDPAPVAAAAAPSTPPASDVQTDVQAVVQPAPTPEVNVVEEGILLAQNEAPAPSPVQGTEIQTSDTQVLPQTGGHSGLEIIIGFAMLGSGLAAVFAARRRSVELN
jgi:LPXTG-motif cell wall-anchored protein